ncbi:MAG TPA: dihydrolipoamide acetyltransferase family protein [Limnochordales bacterium]
MAKVTMPQMGFDMREGTLVRWLKRPGDQVRRGEPIAEVETDKAVVEIESFHTGVVKELLVAEGQTVPVGSPIAIVDTGEADDADAAAPAEAAPATQAGAGAQAAAPAVGATVPPVQAAPAAPAAPTPAAAPAPPAAAAAPPAPSANGAGRIKASPLARRLAAEHGISLRGLTGTGPGGRIVKQDVLAAVAALAAPAQAPTATAAAAPAAAAPAAATPVVRPAVRPAPALVERVVPLSRMRQTIARRMAESKQQAPHFYVTMAIDMDRAMALRQQIKELGDDVPAVSVNDLVLKATALALVRHPSLNASFEGDAIRYHGAVHLAMAVALPDGLVTPVIRDAHAKSLAEIAREARELAEAARGGRLKPEQYQGGTFTVSNLGMFGVEDFVAIINPPQGAILAVGGVLEQPVVRGGQLTVGRVMRVTVSADHRVTDGAQVAQFLQDLKAILENPLRLLI